VEFTAAGIEYRAGNINAREQFHIVRRLAPFLKALAPLMAGMDVSKSDPMKAMAALPQIGEVLAQLPDEAADYVVFGLLACVSRKQDNGLGWAKVSNGTQLMFQDIDMMTMLTLAARALMANMQGFFSELRSVSAPLNQKQSAQ